MKAGGRHRYGMPYQAVEPRRWDPHRRAEADVLNDREPAWMVVYGLWSRLFFAFAADVACPGGVRLAA